MYKIRRLKNKFIQNTKYYYLKNLEHYTNLTDSIRVMFRIT